jgi:hypothetical protein
MRWSAVCTHGNQACIRKCLRCERAWKDYLSTIFVLSASTSKIRANSVSVMAWSARTIHVSLDWVICWVRVACIERFEFEDLCPLAACHLRGVISVQSALVAQQMLYLRWWNWVCYYCIGLKEFACLNTTVCTLEESRTMQPPSLYMAKHSWRALTKALTYCCLSVVIINVQSSEGSASMVGVKCTEPPFVQGSNICGTNVRCSHSAHNEYSKESVLEKQSKWTNN